jgi:hypothetical protein
MLHGPWLLAMAVLLTITPVPILCLCGLAYMVPYKPYMLAREQADKLLATIKSWTKALPTQAPHQAQFYALTSTTSNLPDTLDTIHLTFDTDSRSIKVDNCSSSSISSYLDDFFGTPTPSNLQVRGIGGTASNISTGTIVWRIKDDEGVTHNIKLPKSLYIPEAPTCLLSPQHWAQTAQDHKPLWDGTWCTTYTDRIILYWGQQKYRRTILLDLSSGNMGSIYSVSGYTKYQAFCSELGSTEDVIITSEANTETEDHNAEVPSDQEEDITSTQHTLEEPTITDFDITFQLAFRS